MSEDSDDDREAVEDIDEGKAAQKRKSNDETIIRSGYLWKKGERRKVRSDLGPVQVAYTFVSCI